MIPNTYKLETVWMSQIWGPSRLGIKVPDTKGYQSFLPFQAYMPLLKRHAE